MEKTSPAASEWHFATLLFWIQELFKKKKKVKVLILYSVDVLLSFKNETCLTKKLSMNFHPHVLMD